MSVTPETQNIVKAMVLHIYDHDMADRRRSSRPGLAEDRAACEPAQRRHGQRRWLDTKRNRLGVATRRVQRRYRRPLPSSAHPAASEQNARHNRGNGNKVHHAPVPASPHLRPPRINCRRRSSLLRPSDNAVNVTSPNPRKASNLTHRLKTAALIEIPQSRRRCCIDARLLLVSQAALYSTVMWGSAPDSD